MLTLHIGGVLAVFPWRGLWRLFGILGMYQGAAQYPGESSAYPMGGGLGDGGLLVVSSGIGGGFLWYLVGIGWWAWYVRVCCR